MIYVEDLYLRLEWSDEYPEMGWYSNIILSYFLKEVRDIKGKVKSNSKSTWGKRKFRHYWFKDMLQQNFAGKSFFGGLLSFAVENCS